MTWGSVLRPHSIRLSGLGWHDPLANIAAPSQRCAGSTRRSSRIETKYRHVGERRRHLPDRIVLGGVRPGRRLLEKWRIDAAYGKEQRLYGMRGRSRRTHLCCLYRATPPATRQSNAGKTASRAIGPTVRPRPTPKIISSAAATALFRDGNPFFRTPRTLRPATHTGEWYKAIPLLRIRAARLARSEGRKPGALSGTEYMNTSRRLRRLFSVSPLRNWDCFPIFAI